MSRVDVLAIEAAKALEDGRDPFSTAFLVEHMVTADECFALSERIATAVRVFQAMTTTDQAIAAAKTVLPPEIAEQFEAHARLGVLRKRLRR